MARPTDQFFRFLRRWMQVQPEDPDERATKIQLVQQTQGGPSPLQTVDVQGDPSLYDDESLKELVGEFLDTAQADADGHTGVVSYCLVALVGHDRRPSERSPVIRLRSSSAAMSMPLDETEAPTKEGFMQQMMRHNEALMRVVVTNVAAMQESQQRLITSLGQQAVDAQNARLELVHKTEEVESKHHERQMDQLEFAASEERKEKAWGAIEKYLPIALAKLKGKPIAGGGDPRVKLLQDVINRIPEKKLEQVLVMLGEDGIPLMEMAIAFREEKENGDADN